MSTVPLSSTATVPAHSKAITTSTIAVTAPQTSAISHGLSNSVPNASHSHATDTYQSNATTVANLNQYRFQSEIVQMMYVCGEVKGPIPEVTLLVEDILRRHCSELIVDSAAVAKLRGARTLSVDDIVFLVRRDKANLNRLKTYLGWKDLRKNVKEDTGAIDGTEPAVEDVAEVAADREANSNVRKNVYFTWELSKEYRDNLDSDTDEDICEKALFLRESRRRLKLEDEQTAQMTQEEYIFYSDCKAASFTHRKVKRFREWAQVSKLLDSRASDDVLEVLGFLCFELLRKLTQSALTVAMEIQSKTNAKESISEDTKNNIRGDVLSQLHCTRDKPVTIQQMCEGYRRLLQEHNCILLYKTNCQGFHSMIPLMRRTW